MTDARSWTIRESGFRKIRLTGGPFDGSVVEGVECDTEDGLPDHVRMESGELYVRGGDDEYAYVPAPARPERARVS